MLAVEPTERRKRASELREVPGGAAGSPIRHTFPENGRGIPEVCAVALRPTRFGPCNRCEFWKGDSKELRAQNLPMKSFDRTACDFMRSPTCQRQQQLTPARPDRYQLPGAFRSPSTILAPQISSIIPTENTSKMVIKTGPRGFKSVILGLSGTSGNSVTSNKNAPKS